MSGFDEGAANLYAIPVRRGAARTFNLASDPELARALLDDLRALNDGDVVYTRGAFWQYAPDRGVWRNVERFTMERLVHAYDGAPFGKEGVLKIRQSTISGALSCAAAIVADSSFFDGAPEGISFADKFVKVSAAGLEVHDHSPEHRATVGLPFAFDAGIGCGRFLRALDEIFANDTDAAEKVQLIRQFIGAALIGVATRYQLALVLFGAGANGKSVLLEVFGALFPEGAVASIPPQELGQEYRRAMLAGVRLNLVNELPERDVLDSEAFKSVISGDLITGRRIREAPFSFKPVAAHLFAGNRLPGTTDQSHGFWRRLVPVAFTRTFAPHEQDAGLAAHIVRSEIAGVARWALEGAAEVLRAGGYRLPPSVIAAREEWRRNADQVRLFADARLAANANGDISGQALYEAYVAWAQRNGHKALASNKFAERLEMAGFEKKHTRTGNRWAVVLIPGEGL
jgi:putative DNA primase/helicase